MDIIDIEHIFKSHYTTLCNIVYKIVGDKVAAEDIVQDVFLKLWKSRHQLNINTSLEGYLYRAATNTAITYLKKNKKIVPFQEELHEQSAGTSAGTDAQLNRKELEGKITEAINNLPPRCKTIFVLSRHEDMRYKEIAEYLQISIKTVENQMGKALKLIKQHLTSKSE